MLDAKHIKVLREKRGLSQAGLSARIGVDRQYVWKLEHEVATDIRASTLAKLADALDCTTDELLGRNLSQDGEASR